MIKVTRVQSPSSINTYKQCPRRYYYSYVLKLPTKPSIHLTRGKVAHSALEDFFKVNIPESLDGFEEFLQKTILSLFSMHWDSAKKELDSLPLTDAEKRFYHKETQLMLINWLYYFIKRIKNYMEDGKSFQEAFDILTPEREVKYRSETYGVQGFIDAIEKIDGKVKLVDYKTSKKFDITPAYELQLAIYSLLYKEKHNELPDEVTIFFLKSEEKTLPVTPELLDLAKFEVEQIHAATESKEMHDYPMKPSPLCKWKTGQCDFYEKCFPNGRNNRI